MIYKPVIVAVGYNRVDSMKRLLTSIVNADYSGFSDITLIISIDESNMSDAVERVSEDINWKYGKKIIRRFPERQGLRKHIIACGDLSKEYGAVILLEDDLVVSKFFYQYTVTAHDFYSENKKICGISLYSHGRNQFTNERFIPSETEYDVFLGQMVVTWGQSWTREQWVQFKKYYIENENQLPVHNDRIPDEISRWNRSWGKYYASYMVEYDKYYVYPYRSLTTCFANVGEHNRKTRNLTVSQVPLLNSKKEFKFGLLDFLIVYDSFYERVLSQNQIVNGIKGNDICFDLSGMKRNVQGRGFVITNEKFNDKALFSFGLDFKPVEMNILEDNCGDFFFLYKSEDVEKYLKRRKYHKYNYKLHYERLCYEHMNMTWKDLIYYCRTVLLNRFFMKGGTQK